MVVIMKKTFKFEQLIDEIPLTIYINDQAMWTLLCSPSHLKELVYGFLISNYIIKSISDVKKMIIDEEKGMCFIEIHQEMDAINHRYITSGCSDSAIFYHTMDALTLKAESNSLDWSSMSQKIHEMIDRMASFQATVFNENRDFIVEDPYCINQIYKAVGISHLKQVKFSAIILQSDLKTELAIACARNGIFTICFNGKLTKKAYKIACKLKLQLLLFDGDGINFVQV